MFAFINRKALLYRTANGGKQWKEYAFGEGLLSRIFCIGSKLYTIKFSQADSHSTIYTSVDFGYNWKIEFTFPNVVADIYFFNNHIYILAKDSAINMFQLFKLEDNKGFRKMNLKLPIYRAAETANGIYYTSSSKNSQGNENLLIYYNISDSSSKTMPLPDSFNCYILKKIDDKTFLTGLESGNIVTYLVNDIGHMEKKSDYRGDVRYFPQGIFYGGNTFWLVAGTRNNFEVNNILLRRSNESKTWETIQFRLDDYIKPFYFIQNGNEVTGWFYSGLGRFQIFEDKLKEK